jgi:hypothetical protein
MADNLNCQKNAEVLPVVCNLGMYSLPLIGFVLKLLTEISNFNRRNPAACNCIYPRIIQSTHQSFIIKVVTVFHNSALVSAISHYHVKIIQCVYNEEAAFIKTNALSAGPSGRAV